MTMRTLSPEESAELAGVSIDTIEKYMAIGLLSSIEESDQGPRFSESDIRALFYTKKSFLDRHDDELPPRSEELATLLQDAAQLDTEANTTETDDRTAAEHETSQTEEMPPTSVSATSVSDSSAPKLDTTEPLEVVSDTTSNDEHSQQQQKAESEAPFQQHISAKVDTPSIHDQIELTKALREQIEVLKEERDWLRQRVEHLEVRGEREQMLLLSESETVRRLVTQRSLTDRVLQTLRLPWISSDGKK